MNRSDGNKFVDDCFSIDYSSNRTEEKIKKRIDFDSYSSYELPLFYFYFSILPVEVQIYQYFSLSSLCFARRTIQEVLILVLLDDLSIEINIRQNSHREKKN